MKKRWNIIWMVCLLLLSSLSMAWAEPVVSSWVSKDAATRAAAYWTKERMLSAQPHPMGVAGAPGTAGEAVQSGNSGQPGAVPGSPGGTSALLSGEANDALALTGAFESSEDGPLAAGYDYPPPHTTFNVPTSLYGTATSTFPYRTIGKVFFTKSDGKNYVCSGSSIGGRAVLTAGHCVSDGAGHWHTNWTFVPAYRNTTAPYGIWRQFWKTTFAAWHTGANASRDVAFSAVSDINGVKLSSKVGWLGFAWNQSYVKHWNMFGYPSVTPYTGLWMVQTQASYSRSDTSKSPATQGIGTTQTPGCSGGPWILNFMTNNWANGVNSYYYIAQPQEIFSPHFDTAVHDNLYVVAIAK